MSAPGDNSPPGISQRDLDVSLVRGIAWTGGIRWSLQLVTWAATILVARLLTPADYGLVTMATVYIGLLTLVVEFGVGSAVVKFRDLSQEQVGQLHGLSLVLGLIGWLAAGLAAFPLGRFFGAPQLPLVTFALGFGLVITALQAVPSSVLQRDLRFKLLSQIEGARGLVTVVAMLALAIWGYGYWTLVWANLLGALMAAVLTLVAIHPRVRRPRLAPLREALQFSWHILVSRLSWYTYSNADFLIAGRLLGQTALGFYTLAWTLANVPVEKVSSLVGGISPAFFSAVQSETATLRRYLLRLTEGVALITFPAATGMALVAPEFVALALGPTWLPAVPALQVLALYSMVRSVTPLLFLVLSVTGDSHFVMWNSLAGVVLFPAAFYVGSHWGTFGIAAAWIAAYPFFIVPLCRRVFVKLELSPAGYGRALQPATVASILMLLSVLTLKFILPAAWPLGLRFAVQVVGGAVVYMVAAMAFHRERLQNVYNLMTGRGQVT